MYSWRSLGKRIIANARTDPNYYPQVSQCLRMLPFIWPYNAHPALIKNSTRSLPQGRNADYTTKWTVSGLRTIRSLIFLN